MLKMAWGHIQKGRGAFIFFFFSCASRAWLQWCQRWRRRRRRSSPKSRAPSYRNQIKLFSSRRLTPIGWTLRALLVKAPVDDSDASSDPSSSVRTTFFSFFFFLPFSFLLFNRTFSFFFSSFFSHDFISLRCSRFFFFFSKRFKIRMKIGERFTHVFASWVDCIRIYYSFLVGTYITRFLLLLLLKFQMQQRRCPRGSWFVVLEYLINCQWRAITFRSRVRGGGCSLFIYIPEDVSDIKVEFLTRFRRWLLLGVNC